MNPPPEPKKKHTTSPQTRTRLRNALITGTAGGYLGGMLIEGTTRVKVPALTRKLLRMKRKTIGIHGARTGALTGAVIGAANKGKRSETADAVATGGDWKFGVRNAECGMTNLSAFIEDMTFGALPKDVQGEVSRFVDAKKGTPVVHYGMTVTELVMKADATNLAAARKALGTLRASRARDDVMAKVKDGSKYVLLMNDRIVDGHHFLAKAERGAVMSSLNVLDLTPARLSTGKVTEFAEAARDPTAGWRKRAYAQDAGQTVGNFAGAVGGAKLVEKLWKKGKISSHVMPPALLAAAAGGSLVGSFAGKRAARKIHDRLVPENKRPKLSKTQDALGDVYAKQNAASYVGHAAGGAGLALAGRGILRGRAGVTRKTAAAGAGAAVLVRALRQKKINRVEDADMRAHQPEKDPVRAIGNLGRTLKHNTLPVLGLAGGTAALVVNRKKILETTGRMARKMRAGSRHQATVKRTKVVPQGKGPILDAATGEKLPALPQKRVGMPRKARAAKRTKTEKRFEIRFAEGEPRRNRTRDLRDKIGLAKDVAGLGVIGGVGYGAHRLYKKGLAAVAAAGPKFDSAMQQVKDTAAGWKQTADVTNKNVRVVGDLAGTLKRKLSRVEQEKMIRSKLHAREQARKAKGLKPSGLRKAMGGAPKAVMGLLGRFKMFNDPRPVLAFNDNPNAKRNAALMGAAVPVAAGGLILGTRGGRNALRGLLKRVDKNDPRRVRMAGLVQKRKEASIKRAGDKAVGKARAQFRAEALPKAPKEPGLKDAVATVKKRAKRKIVNAVANIGAGPAEQVMSNGEGRMTNFAERDKLSKARDAALLTAGVTGTGAVLYGAHKLHGLKSSPVLRKGKAIAENVRNATSITADAGRIYNHLKDPIMRPKRVIAGARRGWKQGMKEAMNAPAPKWKKGVIKIGKKLRLLETGNFTGDNGGNKVSGFRSPFSLLSPVPTLNQFGVAGLVGSGLGTLIGSQIGERFKYKTRNFLKKKLIPRIGQKWGRRVARAGQFVPENAGAALGGVAGAVIGGGIRNRSTEFGGNDQLQDLNSGGFARPLDVFVGRKRGYKRTAVKEYHEARRTLEKHATKQVKLKPETIAALKAKMQKIRDNPEQAAGGQLLRSAMREGDTIQRWAGRGKGLAKDAVAHLRGDPREKDAWGRSKKREWEKGWFQRTKDSALAGGALLGGYALLKRYPKVRAKADRAGRQIVRAVNSKVGDLLPRMGKHWTGTPLTPGAGMGKFRVRGAKPASMAPRTKAGRAQEKAVKAQVAAAEAAAKTDGAAARAASAQKLKPVKPKRGSGTPPLKGLARLNGRLIQFDDPLDVGWDIRDARGRSARVFAPDAGHRDRRPKKWHEKIDNERKLWGAAALTGTLTGAAATRKLIKAGANKEIKRRLAQIGAAVKKNYVAKSKPKPSNIHAFKPEQPMRPGTAA